MVVAANEGELQLILSLDDTKDDQASPSIRQSTNSFTVNELISVLERISSKLNTYGKELFTVLDCFVSALQEMLILRVPIADTRKKGQ